MPGLSLITGASRYSSVTSAPMRSTKRVRRHQGRDPFLEVASSARQGSQTAQNPTRARCPASVFAHQVTVPATTPPKIAWSSRSDVVVAEARPAKQVPMPNTKIANNFAFGCDQDTTNLSHPRTDATTNRQVCVNKA